MDKQSININIFGRQFPAKVTTEEAAVIREAEKVINDKMRTFRTQYRMQEDLDIAIMCCLDIMTEYLAFKSRDEKQRGELLSELSVLEEKLDHNLHLAEEA